MPAARLSSSAGLVVVREHVGQVFGPLARLLLDPRGGCPVTGGACGTRDLRVADVLYEHMPEAVFGFAFHVEVAGRAHELLTRQLVQGLLHLARITIAHRDERARPEHLAHDGGVLKQGLALGRAACPGGRRSAPAPSRDVHLLIQLTPVRQQTHELLCVQRVAAGSLEQRPLRLRRQNRPLEEDADEAGRLLLGERREIDPLRVLRLGTERRVPLVQLWPGGAEEKERDALAPSRPGARGRRGVPRLPSAGPRRRAPSLAPPPTTRAHGATR